jgi:hypothetical protein
VTSPATAAARAAAVILAPDLGPGLPADVEAALHARDAVRRRPGQYDTAVIAGLAISAANLIVTAAQLAWSILTDRRPNAPEPSRDQIARQIRITLHEQDVALPHGSEHITSIVITEVIRIAADDHP